MKKLLLLLLLLLPVTGWGATYYVSPLGSNTSPYDTWAKAANLPETVITAGNSAAGPHTAYIAPGDYIGGIEPTGNWAHSFIIGTTAHGSTTVNTSETVIIDNNDSIATLNNTTAFDGLTIKGITLKAGGAYAAFRSTAACDSWVVEHCGLIAKSTHASNLAFLGNSTNITWKNNKHRAIYNTEFAHIKVDGTTSGDIYYNDMQGPAYYGIWSPGSSTGNINVNDNVIEAALAPTYFNGSGTATPKNNILIGGLLTTNGSLVRAGGTVNAYNNFLSGNANDPDSYTTGTINTDTDNIKGGDPRPRSWGKTGYIMIRVDDSANLAYASSVESVLAARGLRGSYFVEQAGWNTANNAALRAMVSAGTMEVGVHSRSHSNLNLTGNAFTITKTDKTINIDRTADTITVSDTVTVTGYKAKTLTAIRSELTAGGATVGALTTNLSGNTLGESLADSSGAQASPYTAQLLIDATGATGFFKVEITDPKTWLADTIINGAGNVTDPQTGTTYVANSFANPYNLYNANASTAIRTVGYTSGASTSAQTLWSYNLYRHNSLGSTAFVGADVATTKKYIRTICSVLAQTGGAMMLLAHSEAEVSTTAENGWTAVLDAIAEFGSSIVVTTPQLFSATVKASPWTYTAGTGISTRTYTTYSDFRLRPSSPCINAGVDVGLTTDFAGRAIRGLPDIGAYEFHGVYGGFLMGLGVGF